jgi:hypothetical protein
VSPTEAGLRRFLLGAAAASSVAIPVELLLQGHTESPVQALPFVACAVGLLGAATFARRPGRRSARLLRLAAGLGALLGAFGTFEHLEHNYAFEAEIRPSAPAADLVLAALTGASPPLAPGALVLVAALLFAATWRHPALAR